jgi:hypothetical protein
MSISTLTSNFSNITLIKNNNTTKHVTSNKISQQQPLSTLAENELSKPNTSSFL